MYRLTGQDGVEKYFRMHVEDFEVTQADPVTGQEMPTGETKKRVTVQPYGANGMIDPLAMQQYETRGKFDVRVTTGSSLPFAKSEKEQKLLNYFDRGIIDEEEVLKGSDYPNYQAVLQRVEQKKMMAAQAQASGAAPPPAA
jgi:hypothetical protein